MFEKSYAHSAFGGILSPSQKAIIEVKEMCCVCDGYIPEGRLVMRKKENKRVICLPCIIELAEVM